MSTAANSFASGPASRKSYDAGFLISIAIIAVGVIVVIYALASHGGVSSDALSMTALPP